MNLQKETLSNLDYLKYVLESELEAHRAAAIQKRRKDSRLPRKVFSSKNMSPGVKWHVEQLERLEWLREATDITIIGKCDSGKTALAAHLGELALQEGMRVFYCDIDEFLSIHDAIVNGIATYTLKYSVRTRKGLLGIKMESE